MKIGIVGLGLMGGSFAKACKKYKISTKIVGYDQNHTHEDEAIKLGLVEKIVSLKELKNSDVIILAIPVDAIISFLPNLIDIKNNTTVIDFGSTKELIVKNIPVEIKQNYIPAHPMTGNEKFGPYAALDNLYENKIIVLCDLEDCSPFHKQRAINIFQEIGMNLVFMDSVEHDIHACYISHLPHAISFALANMVMSNEKPQDIVTLAAGGFKDMSRIAKSSPQMWSDIFRQNKSNLLEALKMYQKQLTDLEDLLENDRFDEIKEWMQKSNKLHNILS